MRRRRGLLSLWRTSMELAVRLSVPGGSPCPWGEAPLANKEKHRTCRETYAACSYSSQAPHTACSGLHPIIRDGVKRAALLFKNEYRLRREAPTMVGYIGQRGREKLRRYKYSVIDKSIMAPYFQPYWSRFVLLFPTWVAPNVITCGGASPSAPLRPRLAAPRFFSCFPPPPPRGRHALRPSGLALMVLSAGMAYAYSPRLDQPLPAAAMLAHGFLLFMYQTLDAVDGKQARPRNSCSD